jgi:hypothetical protein
MTKPESLDCVAMKRRAQRALTKALAGKSPAQQTKVLRDLAVQQPLWKKLPKARTKRPRKTIRTPGKRRSTG